MLTSNVQAVLYYCSKLTITAINSSFCYVFAVQLPFWSRAPWPNNESISSSSSSSVGISSTKCGLLRCWPHYESWNDIVINQENTFQADYGKSIVARQPSFILVWALIKKYNLQECVHCRPKVFTLSEPVHSIADKWSIKNHFLDWFS